MAKNNGTFEDLIAEVIQFVEEEIRPFPKKITKHTDFSCDLVLLPEDADDLMEGFFKTFNVSAGDFDGSRYFPAQVSIIPALFSALFSIFNLPFSKRGGRLRKPVRLTIEMLAGAVRDGIWLSDVLEREFCS